MITIPLIAVFIQALIGLGIIVSVYVNLNTKITKLESQAETNRQNISKLDNIISKELKEIKDLIIEMKIELAVQKSTLQRDDK
jgi:wobble nucleotide-excising tRNase